MIIKSERKKRIVLIEPRSPGENIFSMILLPRLGIVLLATILKQKGYEVVVMVENFQELEWKLIKEADLIGISIITCTAPRGYAIAKNCRELFKKPVVIGGSHATFLPEEASEYADYVFLYESEESFARFVDAYFGNDGIHEMTDGIAYKTCDGDLRKRFPARPLEDLDKLPFPNFSLIQGIPKMTITPIMTSRGCPFDCDFCSVIKMFGRKMRYRSIDNVIEEIKYQNPKHIFFYDDNFTINPKRTAALLESVIKLSFARHLTWSAQVSVELAKNEKLVRFMKKSGCEYVYVGFESISNTTLEAYNKKQTREKIEYFVDVFRKNKIRIHGMFVFNPHSDDKRLIRETLQFARKNKIDTVQFLIMTPLPGTPLWAKEEKSFLTRDWSLFDAHHVVIPPKYMSDYELQKQTTKIMKRFYSLRRVLAQWLKGNILVAKFRFIGWKTIKQWLRLKSERDYLRFLKNNKK